MSQCTVYLPVQTIRDERNCPVFWVWTGVALTVWNLGVGNIWTYFSWRVVVSSSAPSRLYRWWWSGVGTSIMCSLTPTETMWVGNHSRAGKNNIELMLPKKGTLNSPPQQQISLLCNSGTHKADYFCLCTFTNNFRVLLIKVLLYSQVQMLKKCVQTLSLLPAESRFHPTSGPFVPFTWNKSESTGGGVTMHD